MQRIDPLTSVSSFVTTSSSPAVRHRELLHEVSVMKVRALCLAVVVSILGIGSAVAQETEKSPLGYTDTPQLPGQPWLVHDPRRPQPPVVEPGATFSQGAPAPADATVLFAGGDLSQWTTAAGEPPAWRLADDYMEVKGGSGSIRTRQTFGDFQLHLEFATPKEVMSSSQGRGNSGLKIYGDYEIQVLDSFDNPTYPDGQAGSIYGQTPPAVNASKPPGEWQTYDIVFEAPRWQGDRLTKKANVTVFHNGVLLHHKQEFIGKTIHKQIGHYRDVHEPRGFLELQDHGNPVRFRNIWIRQLVPYDSGPSE
jgi:hypothetical protein